MTLQEIELKYKVVVSMNTIYGRRAALREAKYRKFDVQYNQETLNLDCFENGQIVYSFKAN